MNKDKYSYNDANPTYRLIKRTFTLLVSKHGIALLEPSDNKRVFFLTPYYIEAKCVMYSHIKLLGILRPCDKRVYLN